MIVRAQFVVLLFVGLAVGFGVGLLVIAPSTRVPAQPPNVDELGALIAAPIAVAATPVVADPPDLAGADAEGSNESDTAVVSNDDNGDNGDNGDQGDQGDEGDREKPLVPSTVHKRAVFDDDISLIPRGPGRYAILDMRPTRYKKLSIHAGSMQRSGGGNFANFAKHRKVGSLRGPKVRVELLHLGFDRDGVVTIAHIRLADRPSVEGIINLRRGNRVVRVLPDRGQATSDEPF